ncbi:FAD:protein FMN transferase [Micromonospora sagamiensis]|uniref:FAD:protein FMN transferase n=2 Tax=Micromonospora sagamiensis TaxID=47875 RepID=A0A562WCT0_9ACTN|nr:thiamine biosynthesis lipoprotein [Micromonospora sagamiensis]BCL13153.1 FAD:protein FMN transferase [Micromonospora sagamiensis]
MAASRTAAAPPAVRPGLRRVEQVMGTPISLDLADDLPRATLDDLADEVFGWLREVDARFSTYRADSEVSRFDRGEVLLSEASPDLRLVLERCADLWGATDGWFDAYATGAFDPSGYVKGWAAQVASDRLLAAGAANHCLNAGGDVRVRGLSPAGRPWRIGIQHPWDRTATFLVLTGTDLAVATSGVYERGHHVLDPRRGEPARGLRSVTVVGPDLGVADAYATAAVAMGSAGVGWLGRLAGHEHAVVTDTGRCLRSPRLPAA